MIKTSIGWVVLVFSFLLSACVFPSGTPQGNATQKPGVQPTSVARADTPNTPVPATPTPSRPTSTPKPTAIPSNLEIIQVYLRYDSQEPEGTFEVTVCNPGPRTFKNDLEVTFEVNGITSTVTAAFSEGSGLPVNQCRDIYADVGFSHFGITQPGEVEVRVRLRVAGSDATLGEVYRERLHLRDLTPGPPEEALARYQKCLKDFAAYGSWKTKCMDRLPDYPLAEMDEIAKRWDVYTVIASREYEDLLAPWLLLLRTCTPEVQRFLGIPQDFQVPVLVVRSDPDLFTFAVTKGASIFTNLDFREDEALMEMSTSGCQPGRMRSTSGAIFVHEIVHALKALYIENEWHSYFYGLVLDDGTEFEGEYPDYIDLLPYSLEEGIGYWTGASFTQGNTFLFPFDWQCTAEGWVDDEGQVYPYMPLDFLDIQVMDRWVSENLPPNSFMAELHEESPRETRYSWHMATARCFWDTLIQMEGREVVGQIWTQLREYPEEDTCEYPFVDVALAPVVREETLQEIARRFNVRRGVEACSYQ